MIDPIAY